MDLCKAGKQEECIQYLKQYFYRTHEQGGGVYFLIASELNRKNISDDEPQKPVWQFLTNKNISDNYLIGGHCIYAIVGNKRVKIWSARDWFFNENTDVFTIVRKFNSPTVDYEKQTINVMGSSILTRENCGTLEDLSEDAKSGATMIYEHIQKVWTSEDKEQCDFVMKWLAHVIVGGKKMGTALYLKSPQGTGKSMIITFLMRKLLGYTLTLQTLTHKMLQPDAFNSILDGKLLVNFNEIPKASPIIWDSMQATLRNLITEKHFSCNEKFVKSESRPNTFNLIIDTNDSPIKITEEIRRYCVLDVNESKKGDKDYFGTLKRFTENPEVAKAFYLLLIKIYDDSPDFTGQFAPKSKNFHQGILDGAHPVLKILKEEWLDEGNDFQMTVMEFRKYLRQELNGRVKNLGVPIIKKLLSEVGVHSTMNKQRKQEFNVKHADLLKGFQSKFQALRHSAEMEKAKSEVDVLREQIRELQKQVAQQQEKIEELELDKELTPSEKTHKKIQKQLNVETDIAIQKWVKENPPKNKKGKLSKFLCKIER